MATSSRKLGKQPLGDTRASPVPAVLDRVNEEPSQDEAEASTRKPRASTATPDADSSASRTSTSSRSAKDNDGSPSSSQASTLGKLRAGEDAAQLSVSSLLSQATAGTDRYALAGPSTATPVLDGIRALIHDLTTIEFNFGGLPIRLRLGLLWFVLILVGGILLIRSQVLRSREGQSPVEQPQNGTPVIVSHGGSGSVNGTEDFTSLPELVTPTCSTGFVFNAASGFCDFEPNAATSPNATNLLVEPMLPTCTVGRVFDPSTRACRLLSSGEALAKTNTSGAGDIYSLMHNAELYANLQRTRTSWIFLTAGVTFNIVSIGIICHSSSRYILLLSRFGLSSFIRHSCTLFSLLKFCLFLGNIGMLAYITTHVLHSGLSTERSDILKYAIIAWLLPFYQWIAAFFPVIYWLLSRRSHDEESPYGHKQSIKQKLRRRVQSLDDLLDRYSFLQSSWRHPFRTLGRWTVRSTLETIRFFLFLAHWIWPKDNSDPVHVLPFFRRSSPPVLPMHSSARLPRPRLFLQPLRTPRNHPDDLEVGSLYSAPDGSVSSGAHEGNGLGQPPLMERWIQNISHPGTEDPDNPLQMAPHNFNSNTDLELGLDIEHLERAYLETLSSHST